MLELASRRFERKGLFDIAGKLRSLIKDNGDIASIDSVIFSLEQQKQLEARGYKFSSLTRQPLESFFQLFYGRDRDEYEGIGHLQSMRTEVAFNPKNPYLPNDKKRNSYGDLLLQTEKFAEKLGSEVPGVTAIIGSAPDYAELISLYLSATGTYRFWDTIPKGDFCTTTYHKAAQIAIGTNWDLKFGLSTFGPAANQEGAMYAMPIVIPIKPEGSP
jgi:phage gpG-like protein